MSHLSHLLGSPWPCLVGPVTPPSPSPGTSPGKTTTPSLFLSWSVTTLCPLPNFQVARFLSPPRSAQGLAPRGPTGAPHLLAFLLSSFLIRLSLLGPVDGILLVQFQHLHLLLDGLHGWADKGAGGRVCGGVCGVCQVSSRAGGRGPYSLPRVCRPAWASLGGGPSPGWLGQPPLAR